MILREALLKMDIAVPFYQIW